jgi:hypothetical protein
MRSLNFQFHHWVDLPCSVAGKIGILGWTLPVEYVRGCYRLNCARVRGRQGWIVLFSPAMFAVVV